jgi:hypothetical protein
MAPENQPRIVLMTQEFDRFRRVAVTIPEHLGCIVQVSSEPAAGEFTIGISAVDSTVYYSRKRITAAGHFPLQLTVFFPDSMHIVIKGKTVPFEQLVGYQVLGEDLYLFDIYRQKPLESFFRERTVAATVPGKGIQPGPVNEVVPEMGRPEGMAPRPRLTSVAVRVTQAAMYAGLVAVVAGLFGVAGMVFFKKMAPAGRIQADSSQGKVDDENNAGGRPEDRDSQPPSDGETAKTVSRDLSYDEATLVANISGK